MRMWFLILSLAAAAGTGCAGPCEDLANNICDCDEDPSQRQACRNQVLADARRIPITSADSSVCSARLKDCPREKTCELLRTGNRAACGFTRE